MSNVKLWLDDHHFVEVPPARPSEDEIVTMAAVRDMSSGMAYLPNPDEILRKAGRKIDVYRTLYYDAMVRACTQQLSSAVKALEWDLDRGRSKNRYKRECVEWLRDFDFQSFIDGYVEAWNHGYQPFEIPWQQTVRGNLIMPKVALAKPQEWFAYDPNTWWKYFTKDNRDGIPIDPATKNFLFAAIDASYDNPYGIGALSGAFWPVTFKRGGIKFWLLFVEKFGVPHVMIKVPASATDTERSQALSAGQRMIQDAVLVLTDTQSYETMEVDIKGGGEAHRSFLSFLNDEISLSIIHQTMTSDVSDNGGGYASSKTGESILNSAAFALARQIEKGMNTILRWIAEVNWNTQESPSLMLYERRDVDKDLAERDDKLSTALDKSGLRLTRSYFTSAYYLDDEQIEEKPAGATPATPATFAEPGTFPDQAAVDAMLDTFADADLQQQIAPAVQPVIDFVKRARSYREVEDGLASVYSDMDTERLQQTIAMMYFLAEMQGRQDA
ncbi:MAG: DUF935 family protein [Ignavibacteriae bacterium]|nr:DUF935 family protein [Ignavibacteriota bacterium]